MASVKKKYRRLPLVFTAAAFAALITFPDSALNGANNGISVCLKVIIPALFPFFVLSGMLLRLGLPKYLGRVFASLASRLFSVSGEGVSAFILGLSGGYPLGASVVAELYMSGDVKKKEAERMLAFCNNSGPSFIVGAVGAGVFRSPAIGFLLYVIHALSSVVIGAISAGSTNSTEKVSRPIYAEAVSFPAALTDSVKKSVLSIANICGFVIFFAVLTEILDAVGLFSYLVGYFSLKTPLDLHNARALLTGLLELGGGIGAMSGSETSPENLALCSFLLGWGGLSVHCQTIAVIGKTGLSAVPHFFGRLIHGLISAILSFFAAMLFL